MKNRSLFVPCPHCQHQIEIVRLGGFNIDIDPKAKEKIISGRFFEKTCSQCQKVTSIVYPMLFRSTKKRYEIWILNDEEDRKRIGNDWTLSSLFYKDISLRIVQDIHQLCEKVMIFDNGLDDRVIEIMKMISIFQIKAEYPERMPKRMYFLHDTESSFVIFDKDDKRHQIYFQQSFYDSVSEELKTLIDERSQKVFQIDQDWALSLLPAIESICKTNTPEFSHNPPITLLF